MLLERKIIRNTQGKRLASGVAAIVALVTALSACSASFGARISADGDSFESAVFSASLSPLAERLAQSFSGRQTAFNKQRIENAFASIDFPSPASVSIKNDGSQRLEMEFGRISLDSGIFLTLVDGNTKAFDLDENRLLVTLSRKIIAKTIQALPKELFEYADFLMAPVLTGGYLSEDEYIDLIAAAYGPQAASELKSCSFTLSVQCPSRVIEASAREFPSTTLSGRPIRASGVQAQPRGNEARFVIPAVKLFTLSSPLQLEVRWE